MNMDLDMLYHHCHILLMVVLTQLKTAGAQGLTAASRRTLWRILVQTTGTYAQQRLFMEPTGNAFIFAQAMLQSYVCAHAIMISSSTQTLAKHNLSDVVKISSPHSFQVWRFGHHCKFWASDHTVMSDTTLGNVAGVGAQSLSYNWADVHLKNSWIAPGFGRTSKAAVVQSSCKQTTQVWTPQPGTAALSSRSFIYLLVSMRLLQWERTLACPHVIFYSKQLPLPLSFTRHWSHFNMARGKQDTANVWSQTARPWTYILPHVKAVAESWLPRIGTHVKSELSPKDRKQKVNQRLIDSLTQLFLNSSLFHWPCMMGKWGIQ